jgi:Na+-driven multidrug efflux pump
MVENILLLFAISKTLILHLPVLGITQGFIPIAGYNYGAEKI